MVDTQCACGNVRARAMCGSCTARPASSRDQVLPCTDACAVLKRNAALAEALGISTERVAATASGRREVDYDEETLDFFAHHPVRRL